MPSSLRPAPPPEQINTRRIVAYGSAAFALAAIIIALVPAWRSESDGLWLWTAIVGTILGLLGQLVMRWQKAP